MVVHGQIGVTKYYFDISGSVQPTAMKWSQVRQRRDCCTSYYFIASTGIEVLLRCLSLNLCVEIGCLVWVFIGQWRVIPLRAISSYSYRQFSMDDLRSFWHLNGCFTLGRGEMLQVFLGRLHLRCALTVKTQGMRPHIPLATLKTFSYSLCMGRFLGYSAVPKHTCGHWSRLTWLDFRVNSLAIPLHTHTRIWPLFSHYYSHSLLSRTRFHKVQVICASPN